MCNAVVCSLWYDACQLTSDNPLMMLLMMVVVVVVKMKMMVEIEIQFSLCVCTCAGKVGGRYDVLSELADHVVRTRTQ